MGYELDALDRALARVGTAVVVRRVVAGVPSDANCKASVRSFGLKDDPLRPSSEQAQDEILVIMSPTDLKAAGWPGAAGGPSFPQRGDFVAVMDGVHAGQELVTSGAFKLRNGAGIVVNNSVKPTPELAPRVENR